MANVSTADIITEEEVRRVVQAATEEDLQFRRAYRNIDIDGLPNDTITLPKDDDTMAEPEHIGENMEFPMDEEDTSTITSTVDKYGLAVSISMEAEADSVFDIQSMQVEKKARKMQEKLNELAFNNLNSNLHSSSPAGNQGDTSLFEYDDVIDAERVMREDGYSPDTLIVSTQAHADLKVSDEFNSASDLGDRVAQSGQVGRVGGYDIFVDNDGHIGSGTAAGYLIDTSKYGFEVTKGGIQTDEWEDPSRQAQVFNIWTRIDHVTMDSSAAIKVDP